MMCEKVYQSAMCWEFSELCTTPCHSFTVPQAQIGSRPMAIEQHGLQRDQRRDRQRRLRQAQCERRGLPASVAVELGHRAHAADSVSIVRLRLV